MLQILDQPDDYQRVVMCGPNVLVVLSRITPVIIVLFEIGGRIHCRYELLDISIGLVLVVEVFQLFHLLYALFILDLGRSNQRNGCIARLVVL